MRTLLLFCFLCLSLAAGAQMTSLREKIYMHFDKNEYVVGDTIWFKTYVVDALTQKPAARSGIYYVELINQKKDFVRRFNYHVVLGTSFGQIPTDTAFFEPGLYKIRAYTRWMQNFGDTLFYEKDIVVNDANVYDKWFLNMSAPVFNGDSVNVRFNVSDELGRPLKERTINFTLQEGKRGALIKDKLQLDDEGGIDLRFTLPEQYKKEQLHVRVGDGENEGKVHFSSLINFKKPDVDLQFMPEGGHLVAGLINKVGFKAIDQNGLGIDVEAAITDNSGRSINLIKSFYKGMGFFSFLPEAGKSYKAVLKNGREYALPQVEARGVILKVEQNVQPGKVLATIKSNTAAVERYMIAITSRGYEIHKAAIALKEGSAMLAIPLEAFPTGVATFTLSDLKGMRVSERQIFINNNDALKIDIEPLSDLYSKRDSVVIKVKVRDKEGRPVLGSFSLAVTDDGQVKKDELRDENILTYLLLQSDLKGSIETPAYYFKEPDSTARALDALMLTQGFVRYSWDSTRFAFAAEQEYMVSGRVRNIFNKNKGLPHYGVSLYTYRGAGFRIKTAADEQGYFVFRNIPQFDTAMLFLSTKRDTVEYKYGDKIRAKRFRVDVELDKPVYPSLKPVSFSRLYHPGLNLDSGILKTVKARNTRFVSNDPLMMAEVTVSASDKSKKATGLTSSDQLVTKEEIQNADSDMDIFDFLEKHIEGYVKPTSFEPPEYYGGNGGGASQNFYGSMKGGKNRIIVFIDGQTPEDPFLKVNIDFRRLKPKDIKSIELVRSLRRSRTFNETIRNLTADETIKSTGTRDYTLLSRSGMEYYYLVINSYSGAGVGLVADSRNPGFDQIPSPVFHYGKSSYVPKYDISNKDNPLPDYRSTVYWEPTVVTNEKGEAIVSFYAADNPGTYTLSLQGLGLQGDIGFGTRKLKIGQ